MSSSSITKKIQAKEVKLLEAQTRVQFLKEELSDLKAQRREAEKAERLKASKNRRPKAQAVTANTNTGCNW